jgi:hypothetical protein|tara:strand:+ start:535 stop:714 length:180 start_codon:yes stop_codon:yes gene_type:complete
MKDSTTISPETKLKTVEALEQDITRYLANGGQVKAVKSGESGEGVKAVKVKHWGNFENV